MSVNLKRLIVWSSGLALLASGASLTAQQAHGAGSGASGRTGSRLLRRLHCSWPIRRSASGS